MSTDLLQAAYSVLLPAFSGLTLSDDVRRFLSRGGVSILLGESREEYLARAMTPARQQAETREQFLRVTEEARKLAGAPILVAVDQELGGIQRLHQLVPALPSVSDVSTISSAALEQHCFAMAEVAQSLGINLFLAPIVDVVTGTNPWLRNRNLGADPHEVSRVSQAFIRGVQRAGVVATAKHFPGHYHAENDPAVAVAWVPEDAGQLQAGLQVFREIIGAGVQAIMPGPATFPAIDDQHSASTSAKVIGLLRDTLSFGGLIISDDLDAVSILRGNSITQTAVAALGAGAHLLLVSSEAGLDALAEAIVAAVNDGTLAESTVLDAARKTRELAKAFATGI